MKRTDNYNLIVVEGRDKVNLLTQMNPNTERIDEVLKNNENTGVHEATELLSGTIHALTRSVPTASMFKFTAVSNYTAGDTFTVDGIQVTALLTSGEALGTGAYIIGSEVLCSLKDTLLTIYTQGGTVKTAEDSEKLGGNLPEYYAKQSELNNVKSVADSASSLSRKNSDDIIKINEKLLNENYSTNEIDTGITWVDNKKIYKKSIVSNNLSSSAGQLISIGSYPFDNTLDKVVKIECLIERINPLMYTENCSIVGVLFRKDDKSIQVSQAIGTISFNCVVTVYYTKNV